MNLQPRIVELTRKKLVGKNLRMSLKDNRTADLWRSFMPVRTKIGNRVSPDLISMRVYDRPMVTVDMSQEFDKWAAAEVTDFSDVPEGMESFELEGGLYAVFDYKGSNTDNNIFINIFRDWLPYSEYDLDERPQFEVLGDKYRNNDPNSEEEIWIPVKPKK